MVQHGLDAARDVRVAHANLLLAQQRAQLTAEAQTIFESIADLAGKRLDAGDISELEATSSRIEALRADATSASAKQDIVLAQEQLRTLIGVPLNRDRLYAVDGQLKGMPSEGKETLVAMAFAMRPDFRAIELRKAAACERARLACKQFMTLDLGYDANAEGLEGYESGLATRATIPIFNGNKGKKAIADSLVRQVDHQYVAARDRIELEVRTALTQLEQALEQRQLVEQRILPAIAEAGQLARRNYEDGGVPYFLVLQTTAQFVDAQLRHMEAAASVRRAYAELERSVGRTLAPADTQPEEVDAHAAASSEWKWNLPPQPPDG
jgi:cobalt-zinc-cadmium efflux system outer membrane protein